MASVPIRELLTRWGFDVDEKPIKELEGSIRGLKSSLKEIGVGFVAAGAGVGFFLNKAGEFEQTNIAFETMLGNADLAKQTLEELFDFAKTTPFEIDGVVTGGKRLLAFGFEAKDLVRTLTSLGNISAGVGRDKLPQLILALGQVRAATKLRGQELRQFTEAGVPLIEELAKTLNVAEKDIQDLVSSGNVSFQDVDKALSNLTTGTGRFANLMQKQSQSFLGIVSNIKDVITLLARDIGDDLLPEAKALAKEFMNYLEVNREIIKAGLVNVLRSTFDFAKDLLKIMKAVVRVFSGFAKAVGGADKAIGLLLKTSSAFIALKLAFHFGVLIKSLYAVAASYRFAGNAALLAQAKMLLIPLAITAIVAAIALITEDIVAFSQGRDSVLGRMVNAFQAAFPTLVSVFTSIGNFLQFAIVEPIMAVIGALKLIGSVLNSIVGGAFTKIASLFSGPTLETFATVLNQPSGESIVPTGAASVAGSPGGGSTSVAQSAQLNVNVQGLAPDAAERAASSAMETALGGILRDIGRSAESPIER